MEKRIGITIILMVAVIAGGFAYASLPLTGSQQNAADEATSVAFQNDGNSWKHVVAALDVTQVDGSIKTVYADLWVKPKGTATVDLSSILGKVNQKLPEGTKIQVQTYTDNSSTSQAPQGVTDNQVTTTTDPAQGGDFLEAFTSRVRAIDPVVSTPRQTVIANTFTAIFRGGQFVAGANAAVPVCANAGGVTAAVPFSPSGAITRVVASTPRHTIIIPL